MMASGREVHETLQRWMSRVRDEFGHESGQAIIKSLLEECGGCRIRVPDLYFLYCVERNQMIRNRFTGANYEELAITFSLKVRQVRRIVNGG
jgi:Mor family transcriptional regulator